IDEAHDDGDVAAGLHYCTERGKIRIDELRFEQQVFGRVAGQREFGKRDDVRFDATRALDPLQNLARVSLNIAHDDVDLCHRQTQLRRVFHESRALRTNATAILTKRESFKPEMAVI